MKQSKKYYRKCNVERQTSLFSKDSSKFDGLSTVCKSCRSSYHAIYRKKKAEKIASKKRKWYSENQVYQDPITVKRKKCRICNKTQTASEFHKVSKHKDGLANICVTCQKEQSHQHYLKNKTKIKAKNKAWGSQNKEKTTASKRNWKKRNPIYMKKYSQRIQVRLANNLRTRLRKAIKNNQKVGSAVRDLGCSIPELIQRLESQFKPGMSWDNYGQWHIDHIIPLNEFNLDDKMQFKAACHYTNLQPLWEKENLSKGTDRLAA